MTGVDLNLIKTFVLLYETRSVTRTAETLFITQPSVSHALRRLRRQFADDLFVRSRDGLAATALAEKMYPSLRQALDVIDETLAGAGEFDPDITDRTFRVRATDLGEMALLPSVLAALEERARHCSLEVAPLDFGSAAEELRQGRADAVICTPRIDAADLRRDRLFQERYVGLCAVRHPRIGGAPTLDEFLAERHIVVDAAAGHVDIDHALVRMARHRDIAVRVPHFAVLPELVACTRYVAVVPSRVAELFTRSSRVRTFTLPVEIPTVEVSLYTARRSLPSPGVDWLRELIADVLRAGDVDPPS